LGGIGGGRKKWKYPKRAGAYERTKNKRSYWNGAGHVGTKSRDDEGGVEPNKKDWVGYTQRGGGKVSCPYFWAPCAQNNWGGGTGV